MTQVVEYEGRVERAEWTRAVRIAQARTVLKQSQWLGLMCAVVIGVLLMPMSLADVVVVLVAAALCGTVNYVLTLRILARRFGREYDQSERMRAAFTTRADDEGLRTRSDFFDDRIPWSHVRRWSETSEFFVLHHSDFSFRPIPKRVLSDAQADALRGLLVAHVKQERR